VSITAIFEIAPVPTSTVVYAFAPEPSPMIVTVGEIITRESELQTVAKAVLTVSVFDDPSQFIILRSCPAPVPDFTYTDDPF
jgi:hypothetical protein